MVELNIFQLTLNIFLLPFDEFKLMFEISSIFLPSSFFGQVITLQSSNLISQLVDKFDLLAFSFFANILQVGDFDHHVFDLLVLGLN